MWIQEGRIGDGTLLRAKIMISVTTPLLEYGNGLHMEGGRALAGYISIVYHGLALYIRTITQVFSLALQMISHSLT